MGEIAHDVVSLVELQMELCKVDTRDVLRKLAGPAIWLAAGGAVAIGSIPVVLLFVAEAMVALTGSPQWLALLIASILGLGAAAILAIVGRHGLREPFGLFVRSREELRRNIQWMKRVLARDHPSHRRTNGSPPLTGSRD